MAANNRSITRTLNRLYRLCKAAERGFWVVSENASNRGLKVILRSYSQQRARFAEELAEEIRRVGGQVSERRSIRGIIHRGRISIRAALTIGSHNIENVILGEALRGEKVLLNAYHRCLSDELPAETRSIVERQQKELAHACDQIELLRGHSGHRLIVRLFDTEEDTQVALEKLEKAGFERSAIDIVDVEHATAANKDQGSVVSETVLSGAFGGALWGSFIGALGGAGLLFIPEMATMMGGYTATWAVTALAGAVFGAIIGVILGFLIGQGASEEDVYLYDDSLEFGRQLVRLHTNEDRAMEASQIMHQVNAAARVRSVRSSSNSN